MIERFLSLIDNHLKAEGFGTGAHHIQRLRMDVGCDEEAVRAFQFADAFCHRHRFSGGGCFIQQRSGGDIEAGQIERDLLEIEQGFKTPLRHFRLIRGISGVPARVLQHITQDHRRQLHGGVTHANVRLKALVTTGQGFQFSERGIFGGGLPHLRRCDELNIFRHDLPDQRVERFCANAVQHLLLLRGVRANMPADKRGVVFKLA